MQCRKIVMKVAVAKLESRDLVRNIGRCEVVDSAMPGSENQKGIGGFVDHKYNNGKIKEIDIDIDIDIAKSIIKLVLTFNVINICEIYYRCKSAVFAKQLRNAVAVPMTRLSSLATVSTLFMKAV